VVRDDSFPQRWNPTLPTRCAHQHPSVVDEVHVLNVFHPDPCLRGSNRYIAQPI
jgi:hypothetical protein